jgi:hypothetical protein
VWRDTRRCAFDGDTCIEEERMLVPESLFGTKRHVDGAVGKLVTSLKRGATLEELLQDVPMVDLRERPSALVWISASRVSRGKDKEDFRALSLTSALCDSRRIPLELGNEVREQAVEFLARSPWGAAVLNCDDTPFQWYMRMPLRPFEPSRQGCRGVLESALQHWAALQALGPRYFRGVKAGMPFEACLPGYGHAAALCGISPSAGGSTGWRSPAALIAEGGLLAKLEDDAFWRQVVRQGKLRNLGGEVRAFAHPYSEAVRARVEAHVKAGELVGGIDALRKAFEREGPPQPEALAQRFDVLEREIRSLFAS